MVSSRYMLSSTKHGHYDTKEEEEGIQRFIIDGVP